MTNTDSELAQAFLAFSRTRLLEQCWPRLKACVEPLNLEQIWWRPNPASNSVGNLILHLNGNVTQWLVASFNQERVLRDRPAEFAADAGLAAIAVSGLLCPEALHSSRPDPKEGRPGTKHNRAYLS